MSSPKNPVLFTSQEKKQYSRHILLEEIGVSGQYKLKQARVLVIGAGGLGCPVLQYLALAGVGTLGIVDGDTVCETNLQRQFLFTYTDVGKSKALQAKSRLQAQNPFIHIEAFSFFLTTENIMEVLSAYDIIVDGTDNFATRYLVNDACVLLDKTLVFGSIFKFEGQVSVLNFQATSGTYRCLYPQPPKQDTVLSCSEVGVLGVLPGIIGSYQANEVIKLITGIGIPLVNTLLCINALDLTQYKLTFSRNPTQPTALLSNYETFCGVSSSKENRNKIHYISYHQYEHNSQDYTLIDVREDWEWEREHLLDSINIPLEDLTDWLMDTINEDKHNDKSIKKQFVFCCTTNTRSEKAYETVLSFLEKSNKAYDLISFSVLEESLSVLL